MGITEKLLRIIAGRGKVFPTAVTGIFVLKDKIKILRTDGSTASVSHFSNDNCSVHRNMLRTELGWEVESNFRFPEEEAERSLCSFLLAVRIAGW